MVNSGMIALNLAFQITFEPALLRNLKTRKKVSYSLLDLTISFKRLTWDKGDDKKYVSGKL